MIILWIIFLMFFCVNFFGDEVFENLMFSSLVYMIWDGDIYEV